MSPPANAAPANAAADPLAGPPEPEVVLVVDDEDPVRKTFQEWLTRANLGCRVLAAADAAEALALADRHPIDLAILDWNLGAGHDGLRLLEDLALFHPDVAAILVTGYAHQATPLDAMRMGVRDYLDKNQELDEATFLQAVRRQLAQIRPARRERRLHASLVAFREAVQKVLPLIDVASAMVDPVPLPEAVVSLVRFVVRTTGAQDGMLVVRSYEAGRRPEEIVRAYDQAGAAVAGELVPWSRSVAGAVTGQPQAQVMVRVEEGPGVQLQLFERGRRNLLAAPLAVGSGVQAVLEVFDKPGPGFTEEDRRLAAAAGDLGAELLRQALGRQQSRHMLLDAVAAALRAGDTVAATLRPGPAPRPEDPAPAAVLEQLRQGLRGPAGSAAGAEEAVRLAEAVRVLEARHGPAAVRHCIRLVESIGQMLDEATGVTAERSRQP